MLKHLMAMIQLTEVTIRSSQWGQKISGWISVERYYSTSTYQYNFYRGYPT